MPVLKLLLRKEGELFVKSRYEIAVELKRFIFDPW